MMQRAAGRLFLFVGAGLLVVFAVSAISTTLFLWRSAVAPGSVTAIVDHHDADGDHTRRPRVVFETADGQRIEFESRHGSDPPSYRVDDVVEVVYDPDQPAHAEINSVLHLWPVSIVSLLVGAGFFGVGLAVKTQAKEEDAGQSRNDPSDAVSFD
jgi:hypothetical protein